MEGGRDTDYLQLNKDKNYTGFLFRNHASKKRVGEIYKVLKIKTTKLKFGIQWKYYSKVKKKKEFLKQKPIEFLACRSDLQEMFKKVLQRKENWYRSEILIYIKKKSA